MAKAKTARKKSAKRKIGRPLAKIDEKRVGELAFRGHSNRRIGFLVGVDEETIKNRFSGLLDKKRAERADHIAKTQLDILDGKAGPGSRTTMAIWLGKNALGQTDKAAIEHKGSLNLVVHLKGPSSAEGGG